MKTFEQHNDDEQKLIDILHINNIDIKFDKNINTIYYISIIIWFNFQY
jgi:hypothetical protein